MQAAFYAAAFYERTGVAIKKFAIVISVDDHEPQVFTGKTFEWLPKLLDARIKYAEDKGI